MRTKKKWYIEKGKRKVEMAETIEYREKLKNRSCKESGSF